jgi:hypothetical protein
MLNKTVKRIFKLSTTSICLSLLIFTSQSSAQDFVFIFVILLLQSTTGALIWLWVTKARANSYIEVIGAGLAIGYLLSVFGSQMFRGTELQRFGPILPSLIGICFSIPFVRKFLPGISRKPPRIKEAWNSFSITLFVLSLLILSTWWRWNPLTISSWWKYQIDVPYIESYSNSIAYLGTDKTFMSQDQSSGYHWFSYGWIGSFNQIFPTEPFYILTRVFPIVSLVMCLALTYAWASRLTESTFVRLLSPIAILVGPGFSIGSGVLIQSPGSAMSLGVGLLFSLLLFEIIEKRVSLKRGLPLLLLLCIGITGGKISTAVVIAFGICALLVLSIYEGGVQRKSLNLMYGLVLFVMFLTYVFVVMSPFTRPLQIGIFKGWIGLFATAMSLSLGIVGLTNTVRHKLLFVYTFTILLSGAVFSLVLVDSSGNQIYFLAGAIGLTTVPSALGLHQILLKSGYKLRKAEFKTRFLEDRRFIVGIIFFALCGAVFWKSMESTNSVIGDYGRTLAPVILFFMPAILYVLHHKNSNNDKNIFVKGKIHLAFYLTGLVAGIFGIILNSFLGPIYSNSSENIRYGASQKHLNGSVSQDYFDAGTWVRSSIPSDAFFFTNRLCLDFLGNEDKCDGLWFMGSAVTRRQFLVEGATYSKFLYSARKDMTENELLSYDFAMNADSNLHQEIWNKDVRFGWIDKRAGFSEYLHEFSSTLYENSTVKIIELKLPSLP